MATIKLLSALPNSLLAGEPGCQMTVSALTVAEVKEALFKGQWQSCVGHESTATLFGEKLGMKVVAPPRAHITFSSDETLIVGLFTPPRRLAEGEKWTRDEILVMPINWISVRKFQDGQLLEMLDTCHVVPLDKVG